MNKCPNCGKRTDALYTSEYHAVTHCGCFYDENNKHCIYNIHDDGFFLFV